MYVYLHKKFKSLINCYLSFQGNTALHHAFKEARFQVIAQLIQSGADVMIKNNEGQTPLDITDSQGNL